MEIEADYIRLRKETLSIHIGLLVMQLFNINSNLTRPLHSDLFKEDPRDTVKA